MFAPNYSVATTKQAATAPSKKASESRPAPVAVAVEVPKKRSTAADVKKPGRHIFT